MIDRKELVGGRVEGTKHKQRRWWGDSERRVPVSARAVKE